MAKALQRRRGTHEEHKNFVGLEGEFTYDTTEKRIVAHDGVTAGGIQMAKKAELDSTNSELEAVRATAEGAQAAAEGAQVTAESAQATAEAALPKSGGTMTGAIKATVEAVIEGSDDTKVARISGGTGWNNGASLVVYGKDHSDNPGAFRIKANDGTNGNDALLLGKPDGTLKWGDKNVVRSVNGTTADADGNVTVSSDGWKEVSSVTATLTHTSDHTVTITGLTSGRPVILKFYAQNGSYGYPRKCYARIKSGLIAGPITGADGSSGSNATTDFPNVVLAQVAKNTNPTFISSYPLLATGTSCSLLLQSQNVLSNNTYKITITAYQW